MCTNLIILLKLIDTIAKIDQLDTQRLFSTVVFPMKLSANLFGDQNCCELETIGF